MSVATVPFQFETSYADAVPGLSLEWSAQGVEAPRLVELNEPLARQLGVDPDALRRPDGVALLVGAVPAGVTTYAQVYAGHQFGGYSPRLGDGRALLLGEVLDVEGRRRDLHLKGSGRTPFARGGDGLAVLGPMLREYLMGEAMHGMGIPTTRALSVVATGRRVLRDTGAEPGAVLCRVAASHLRVGTFQYAAATGDADLLRSLADYAIARHYPQAADADNPYLALFGHVLDAQAALVARWMSVGFVHGVMNTDNMTISGETIDYGPCAFLDAYDPAAVFSSIDHGGRYAYGNQPAAAGWNLARFAESLLPLIDADPDAAIEAATGVLQGFGARYDDYAAAALAAKLGLPTPDRQLCSDLLVLLHEHHIDYTLFFRMLAAGTAWGLFEQRAPFDAWAGRWEAALAAGGRTRAGARVGMDAVNPLYIPRNHRVEEALSAATAGDLGPFERLVAACSRPYEQRPGLEDLTEPAPDGSPPHVTFCGT